MSKKSPTIESHRSKVSRVPSDISRDRRKPITSKNVIKRKQQILLKSKNILPQFHMKTMYTAAKEYGCGSLIHPNKKESPMKQEDKHVDEYLQNSDPTTTRRVKIPLKNMPSKATNNRKVTNDL